MEFYTKIVGVSFDGRQRLIRQTRVGETLSSGSQLGYISKDVASNLAYNMDSGARYVATVTNVTGTNPGDVMGVNILVRQI